MTKTTIPMVLLAASLGFLASPPAPAAAGARWTSISGCSYDKLTGTSRCWGTLRGFRQSTDPNSYARFNTSYRPSLSRSFGAQFNARTYSCTIVPWLIDDATYAQLLGNPDLYFVIVVRTDGACALEQLGADSGHLD